MPRINNPATGISYLARGFGMLTHPGLRRYVLMPLLINILVFSGFIWLGVTQFEGLLDRFLPTSEWLQWLRWILWPLFAIAIVLLTFYTFTVVANLIAAPFNGLLAEKVETQLTGRPPSVPGGGIIKDLVPSVLSELRKLSYFLLRAIPLLILFLIPGINIAAPILWLLFSAWYLSLEYADYPMGNSGLKFGDQHGRMRRIRWTGLGFGGGLMVMMMIPVVNLAAMPAAVAAATIMWVEQRDGLDQG